MEGDYLVIYSDSVNEIRFSFTHAGLIWSEIKQLWDVGLREYVGDMWNVIDFITNALYVATVALRIVSFFQVNFGLVGFKKKYIS